MVTKHAFRYIIGIALAAILGIWVVIAVNAKALPDNPHDDSDEIWVITDVHFLSSKLRDDGPRFDAFVRSGDGKNLQKMDTLLSGFMTLVRQHHPRALLITGDLTLNGEKESHKDLAAWFRQIEETGTSVYVIPGNHDILNPWAREIRESGIYRTETVTAEEFAAIYADFGYSEAISRDPDTLSYLIEPVPGLQFVMLDTNRYEDNFSLGAPETGGQITQDTRDWIEETAGSAFIEGKKIIAAMHHPILEHNPMVRDGFVIDDNLSLLKFFSKLHIRTFLSGHIHIQDIISEGNGPERMLDITTNALSVYPHNYAKILHTGNGLTYEAVSLSSQTELFGESFTNSLRDFFIASSNRKAQRSLERDIFPLGEAQIITRSIAIANLNFFSGREQRDAIPEEAVKLFEENHDLFLSRYLFSILEDSFPSDQTVDFNP